MSERTTLKTGHTLEVVGKSDFDRINKIFPIFEGFYRVIPGNWFISDELPPILDELYDFEFRNGDVLVLTYPKSGTTWMQEIVWTLINNPDLNNPDATTDLAIRAPHLEADMVLAPKKSPKLPEDHEIIRFLKTIDYERATGKYPLFFLTEVIKSPRVIKCHIPLALYPPSLLKNSKVVYVVRDPRDVIISKYYFMRLMKPYSYKGTVDEFIDTFLQEEQFNHPYWDHVKEAFDQRDHPNIHVLYFEDLKKESFTEIKKISEFLNLNRTDKQIQNIVDYTNFKNMKKRFEEENKDVPMSAGGVFINDVPEAEHGFFRKGKTEDWRDNFTADQVAKINKWMEKNMKMFPDDFKYKA